MRTLLSLFIVVLFVPGCRNHMENATNNITPFGLEDTYTITYGGRSYSAVRTIVYKAANQHCEKQGKYFSIQNEEKRTGIQPNIAGVLIMHSNVELVFKCNQRDDQEFKKVDRQEVTSYGTCFAVSPTEVLTSHHVVAGADVVTVQFQGGGDIEASIAGKSQATDLAVLEVRGKTPLSLPLAASRSLAVGDSVFTVGFPATFLLGEEAKFTEGSVSSLTGIQGDASYFQMSVPIQPGNSGGPVVNMDGEVVGIVAATAAVEVFYSRIGALPQNINWASKSDYARLLFEVPSNSKKTTSRQEAIERVRSAVCKVKATVH